MLVQRQANSPYGMMGLILLASAAAVEAKSALNFDFPDNATDPVQFRPSVYPSFINETKMKASFYRPSIDLLDYQDNNDPPFERGRPSSDMKALAEAWASDYDWYEAEAEIFSNPSSHYALTIPQGVDGYEHPVHVHFVHERSDVEDAIPLLFIHGWPSTHQEWSKIIEPLISPKSGEQAFHVVAPDLPGFGFSPAPEYSGFDISQFAETLDHVMKRAGYEKYGVVSTDLGWAIGLAMADRFSEDSLLAHYSDFWLVPPSDEDLERLARNETTEEETAYITSVNTWTNDYYFISSAHIDAAVATASALSDSPVGFGAWLWHALDLGGDGYEYTHHELITSAMMLFIQGTYGGIRVYNPLFQSFVPNIPPPSTVRTGAGVWGIANSPFYKYFPDVWFAPRSWTERVANITYYKRHEAGGHFPALEAPDEYVEELRAFFGGL